MGGFIGFMNSRRLRNAFLNSALLIGSLIIGVFLIEVGLRVFAPIHSSIYQPDDRVLHKHVPHGGKVFIDHPDNTPDGIPVRINSLGFREREFYSKSEGKRMMVYGDSYIAAEYSPIESTFVRYLDRKLPDWEVLNAGVVGYGPDQILLRLEEDIPRFSPDVVIVSIYSGNDYGDLLRNKIFRAISEGLVIRNNYSLSPELESTLNLAAFPRGRSRLQIWRHWKKRQERDYLDAESIRNYLTGSLERALLAAEQQYHSFVRDGNDTVHNLLNDSYDADVAFYPQSASSLYKIELMNHVLGEFKALATQYNLPMAILVIAHPSDICPDYDIPIDRQAYPEYDSKRLTAILTDLSRRHGLPVLNLFDAWSGEDACSYFFRYGNDHWNSRGQARAAELMAEFLESTGLTGGNPAMPETHPPLEPE